MPPGALAVAVMVDQAAAPFAAQVGRRQPREQRRVLPRDRGLVVVAVQRPGLDLALRQLPAMQQAMEGVEDVVALGADRAQRGFEFVGRQQSRHQT